MLRLRADRVAEALATAGLGAWLVATAASQHPHRAFDRFRDYDPTGLFVPNWRFFAPEPAQHDFHLLHRVLTAGGERDAVGGDAADHAALVAPRRVVPGPPARQGDVRHLQRAHHADGRPQLDLAATSPFRLLRDFVELQVRREYAQRPAPQGFQFLIARHTGHDADHEPDYLLASPFVRLGRGEGRMIHTQDAPAVAYGRQFADFYDRIFPPGPGAEASADRLAALHPRDGSPAARAGRRHRPDRAAARRARRRDRRRRRLARHARRPARRRSTAGRSRSSRCWPTSATTRTSGATGSSTACAARSRWCSTRPASSGCSPPAPAPWRRAAPW